MIFIPILLAEAILLYLGQRMIFPRIAARSWTLALVLAAPGTVLHEGSHWLACKLFGLPVARVELFRPRKDEDGSVRLGVVEHGSGGPVEMAVVATAPLFLVPPMILGLATLLFGTGLFNDPVAAVGDAAFWRQVLAVYLLLSCGSAAFPSPGDHIPFFGALFLGLISVAIAFLIGRENLLFLIEIAALVLAPASASALVQIVFLSLIGRRAEAVPRHHEEN